MIMLILDITKSLDTLSGHHYFRKVICMQRFSFHPTASVFQCTSRLGIIYFALVKNDSYEGGSNKTGTSCDVSVAELHKCQVCRIVDRWRACHWPIQKQLIKMESNRVSVCMEHRAVMKVLCNEVIKPVDTYRRRQARCCTKHEVRC